LEVVGLKKEENVKRRKKKKKKKKKNGGKKKGYNKLKNNRYKGMLEEYKGE
jgi:hypothetical protein